MNKFARYIPRARNFVAAGSLTAVAAANAALPVAVTTAITDTGADLLLGATAITVAMIAFWGGKKLGQKLGFW